MYRITGAQVVNCVYYSNTANVCDHFQNELIQNDHDFGYFSHKNYKF